MHRFFIEVPHKSDLVDCTRAVEIFLRTGSHFLTHADWGCRDNEHKAWLVVEVGTRIKACFARCAPEARLQQRVIGGVHRVITVRVPLLKGAKLQRFRHASL